MHDTDRTALEYRAFDQEADEYEFADEFADEFEGEGEGQDEVDELVYEFTSISNEGELDQFIGDFLKKAGKKFGQVVRSPVGQALAPYLKGAAKKYLPIAGGALGGLVGGATGRRLGGQLASKAGGLLGFEGEGEFDQGEIESARAFIEFANEAVKTAATAAGGGQSPQAVAKTAVIAAAKKRAPNLLKNGSGSGGTCSCGGRQSSGRWYRRGRRIVLAGV